MLCFFYFTSSYQGNSNYSTPAPAQPSSGYNSGSYGSGYGYSTGGQGSYENEGYGLVNYLNLFLCHAQWYKQIQKDYCYQARCRLLNSLELVTYPVCLIKRKLYNHNTQTQKSILEYKMSFSCNIITPFNLSGSGAGGAGDAGYGGAEPAYGGAAPAYDSYSQPSYNTYQQPQPQYNNNYGKYRKY